MMKHPRDSSEGAELLREGKIQDRTNRNLAYMIVGAFIAVAVTVLLGFAKVESVLAGTFVGYLSAKCELVLAYYFGSSRGSERKTEIMAAAEQTKGVGK